MAFTMLISDYLNKFSSLCVDSMWWQFCFKLVTMAKQSSSMWSSWSACEGWCCQYHFVATPAGHPALPAACRPSSASSLHTFHTLWVFPQPHFDCIYLTREIASVALIFFLMCFQPFRVCSLHSVGSFMRRSISVWAYV